MRSKGEVKYFVYKEKQQRVYEWIPCRDRLPDKAGMYLCTVKVHVTEKSAGVLYGVIGRYESVNGGEMFWQDDNCFCQTIAWMPLPELYDEGGV